ncbi:unnamed protein product [Linum tenue]|uniref:Uncharacterized protein n=2 Tax=Linum tenue TaxID=586396 RepID=A0AAV0HYS8_9ROSI|nr:unnamed protein product [Linum tenue]
MAVVGNLALLLDVTMPPAIVLPERKTRPVALDLILSLSKRELHHLTGSSNVHASSLAGGKGFESKGEARNQRFVVRGKENSKVNGVDFDSDEENGNGNGEEGEEDPFDWEKEMRKRVKEIEEMKELEKKAEELQSKAEEEISENGEEGREETEEEKRQRVRKELEKMDLSSSALGFQIQIWLAMAYEANNRHSDCITLYQQLERKHPSISIRRQAAELRYILQAPKLKISQEEMVTIPLIGSTYDSYASSWTDKYKDKDEKSSWTTTNQLPSSRDYLGELLQWRPPTGLENNQAFWVALAFWLALVGAAIFLQN